MSQETRNNTKKETREKSQETRPKMLEKSRSAKV
jgi:hypothetical protein